MAVYGVSIYGTSTYGSQAFSTLIADAFVAVPQGYGSLLLSWDPPGGGWTKIRLVRSSFGFPSTLDEGTILFTDDEVGARISYLDTDLREGRFYYYSLFVLLDPEAVWHRVASTFELVPENYGLGDRLYELLPQVHRSEDALNAYQLQRFLAMFGYQLDRVRTEIRTLLDVANIDYVSGGLLPVFAASIGVDTEPELGMITTRRILKNSVYLSKVRGTKPGIEGIASAYTGWGATTVIGKNLAFDYNDSGFVESIGHWFDKANCALDRVVTPAPDDGDGVLRITCDNTSTAVYVLGDPDTGAFLLPAEEALDYTASCDVRTETTARSRRMAIAWLDEDKALISTSTYASVTDSTSWQALVKTATAPANTKWMAVLCEVVTPTAAEVHYHSAFQIEQASAATAWESAREIIIYFDPDRENLVTNPSAENDTAGWAAYSGSTLTQATGDGVAGADSFRVQNTSGTTTTIGMRTPTGLSGYAVEELTSYVLMARARSEATSRDARVSVSWYDDTGALISTVVSTSVTEPAAQAWMGEGLMAVILTSPEGAAFASVAGEVLAVPDLEYHRFDAFLFEQGGTVGEYFDGTTVSTDDHLWAGTAHASASRYYGRRLMKVVRLADVMPKHIPMGVTFRSEFTPVP